MSNVENELKTLATLESETLPVSTLEKVGKGWGFVMATASLGAVIAIPAGMAYLLLKRMSEHKVLDI